MISIKSKAYSVREIRKIYQKAYAPWTKEDDTALKQAYNAFLLEKQTTGQTEYSFFAIYAQRSGRKIGAIRSRVAKLLNHFESLKTHCVQPQKDIRDISLRIDRLEFNPEFQKACVLMEQTDKHVFITGRAGTGKSTLLTYVRHATKKKLVVLAPTGVAALNVRGQTIHSFFRFKPDITLKKVKRIYKKGDSKNLYEKIDTIVIDEISMVRSDLLDCVDKFLRVHRDATRPFGGVQMIFIGDLYQLPPVVTGSEKEIFQTHYTSQYFFDAKVFETLDMEFIELEKVYRQKDDAFIALLNAIRNNSATEEHLAEINKRYDPNFTSNPRSFSIHLTTTNALADTINNEQLASVRNTLFTYTAAISGSFDMHAIPTDIELSMKVGAQIMMLNNDSQNRWVNGTIGKIINIKKDNEGVDKVVVQLSNGKIEEVTPFTWELFHFSFDQKSNSLTSETVGTFTQYPMRLAWAVTIHKSQGKTFDNIIVDIGKGTFVHGQLYVALSRCTHLGGIILKQKIQKKHIFMDWRVVKFVTRFQYKKSEETFPLKEKTRLLTEAINDHQKLAIIYLKANDEKSKRVIQPLQVGTMEYLGKQFCGVKAFDDKRDEERVFRIDRILTMEIMK